MQSVHKSYIQVPAIHLGKMGKERKETEWWKIIFHVFIFQIISSLGILFLKTNTQASTMKEGYLTNKHFLTMNYAGQLHSHWYVTHSRNFQNMNFPMTTQI